MRSCAPPCLNVALCQCVSVLVLGNGAITDKRTELHPFHLHHHFSSHLTELNSKRRLGSDGLELKRHRTQLLRDHAQLDAEAPQVTPWIRPD